MDNYLNDLICTYLGETDWDYEAGLSEDDAEDFLDSIQYSGIPVYDYEIGATKLVIIPYDSHYVIKIPYNMAIHYGEYFDFTGLPKGVNDYCQYELILYNMAKESGWADFFLPIQYLGEFKGIPIYIQNKAEDYFSCTINYASENSKKIVTKRIKETDFLRSFTLPFDWVACCLDWLHSLNELRKFFYFLEKEKISRDLHRGNIGFYQNRPVIIDYGGYFEEV